MWSVEIPILNCRRVIYLDPVYDLSQHGFYDAIKKTASYCHCLIEPRSLLHELYIHLLNLFRALKLLPPRLWHIIRFNCRLAHRSWYLRVLYRDSGGRQHRHWVMNLI